MNQDLTRGQLHMLLHLVRKEAREIGYGTTYSSFDERTWPRRLKQLELLARKLQNILLDQV